MSAPSEEVSSPRRARWRRWSLVSAALGFGLWWVGSILVHGLFFGAMYLASPRQSVSSAANANDFQMTISPAHVASVVAEIREQQKEEFSKKIEELASIKAQLDALDATKIDQYNALMKEEARQAPQAVQQAAADARASQQIALQAQAAAQVAIRKTTEALARAKQAQDDAARLAAEQELKDFAQATQEAQTATSQAQKQASAAQARLTRQIDFFGAEVAAARQASTEATAAQSEAETQQDAAAVARQQLESERQKVEQEAIQTARLHAATAAAAQKVADVEKRLEELQPPPPPTPPPAPSPVAEVSPAASAPPVASDGSVPETLAPPAVTAPPVATPTPTPVPTPTKQVKQEIDRLSKTLTQNQDARTKATAREAEAQQKLDSARDIAARQAQTLQAAEDQARQKQQAALEVQTKAEQTILSAVQKPGLAPTAATASATSPAASPPGADLAAMFRQAQQMEAAVAESYKNVRAAELAAIREIPIAQATALTEVAKPVRAEIDTGILTRDIRDVDGVRAQEKTLEAASEQMNSMVALARRMQELAQPEQTPVSVTTMKAASGRTEHMEELAMEDAGTTAKDLTSAMQGAEHTGGGGGQGGDNSEAIGRATSALAAAAARLAMNPADLGAMVEYQMALAALQALTSGGGDGAEGAGGDQAAKMLAAAFAAGGVSDTDATNRRSAVPEVPILDPHRFKPIPGRTITTAMIAEPTDRERAWMFVDSWYLIGPWPNPRRKNLDTKFPPESVVDLDASYTGGRRDEAALPIRWKFYQASAISDNPRLGDTTGMITPPGLDEFEIYYAYTELWLDEAADLWVAIGSDDQSKVWLNDQMIWKSADYYKGWVANEGLRKVHFQRGINRVLLRLENGQLSGGYSFMVCLDPKAPLPPEAKHASQH